MTLSTEWETLCALKVLPNWKDLGKRLGEQRVINKICGNGMDRDGMEWIGTGWNGLGRDGMKWNGLGRDN